MIRRIEVSTRLLVDSGSQVRPEALSASGLLAGEIILGDSYYETVEETSTAGVEPDGPTGLGSGAAVKVALVSVLAVVAGVFAVQNLDSIGVDFLAWSFDLPLVIIMVGSAVIGAALWEMGRLLRRRRRA